MMNRRISVSLAAATAAVALCALDACSAPSQTPAAPKVVSMDASWAQYYHSMSDLKAHTDIAVEGTITKATLDPRASSTDTPFTDFQFTVGSTYFDPHNRIAAATVASKPVVLTIHQTGGTVNGTTYQIDDDPLLVVGQKYVLFLREYSPGHHMVAGGPTGRFAVAPSGAVTPIVSDGVKFTGTLPAMSQAIKTS